MCSFCFMGWNIYSIRPILRAFGNLLLILYFLDRPNFILMFHEKIHQLWSYLQIFSLCLHFWIVKIDQLGIDSSSNLESFIRNFSLFVQSSKLKKLLRAKNCLKGLSLKWTQHLLTTDFRLNSLRLEVMKIRSISRALEQMNSLSWLSSCRQSMPCSFRILCNLKRFRSTMNPQDFQSEARSSSLVSRKLLLVWLFLP